MDINIKNTPEPESDNLPGSVFYKEDMKKIFEILEEKEGAVVKADAGAPGKTVEILKPSGFDSPQVEGLKFDHVNYKALYGDSYIAVELQSKSGKITKAIAENDTSLEVLYDMVFSVAKKRENHLRDFVMFVFLVTVWVPIFWISSRIVNASWLDGASLAGANVQSESTVQLVTLAIYIPTAIYGAKKLMNRGNILVNSPRGKSQIFRDRMSENWQVSAVWAVVSAFLGFLLGLIF